MPVFSPPPGFTKPVKPRKNPYLKMLKQSVTIRLDRDTVVCFKNLAAKTRLPYQHLINLYLRDCALRGRDPMLKRETLRRRRTTARRQPNPVS